MEKEKNNMFTNKKESEHTLEERIKKHQEVQFGLIKEMMKLPDTLLLKLSALSNSPTTIDYFIMLKEHDDKGIIKLSKEERGIVDTYLEYTL